MSNFTLALLDKFFHVCNEAHEVWILRRTLIDDNPQRDDLGDGHHARLMGSLSRILHEYILLQLGKLHDPAVDRGRKNLSIAYIVEYGGWNDATTERLRALARQLDSLDEQIRPARNRILAHNDLETMEKGEPLGKFPPGADTRYFKTLHDLVCVVYENMTGGPCADFSSLSRTDAHLLNQALLAADAARRVRG